MNKYFKQSATIPADDEVGDGTITSAKRQHHYEGTAQDDHQAVIYGKTREISRLGDYLSTADSAAEMVRRKREQSERWFDEQAAEHSSRYQRAQDRAACTLGPKHKQCPNCPSDKNK